MPQYRRTRGHLVSQLSIYIPCSTFCWYNSVEELQLDCDRNNTLRSAGEMRCAGMPSSSSGSTMCGAQYGDEARAEALMMRGCK